MKRMAGALTDGEFDLLVLGGGITGAGVALDSALRGLRVALIDKGDFASGTSSASSKLVHGGLRYLEQANFHLVYEALHERGLLLDNASHLVHPLRFILPFYQKARVPPWQWRLGLMLYDLLAGASNIQRSRPLDRPRLLREVPDLQPEGLRGGADYFDAQMDDSRLCLEVVRTAALQGACVANYVEAVGFDLRGGEIAGVRVLDRVAGREFSIRARQVLNATGPWVDTVCRLAGDATGPHLEPSKGVHLVLPDRGLKSAFLLLHPRDGRVFFVIPWYAGLRPYGQYGKTLIGTTDTLAEQGPDALTITPEDIDYLLEGFNHHFTQPATAADIRGSFAGLRPLLRAQSENPSTLSREFRVFASASGLLSVAGGKYTTYRRMAEVITDKVVRRLGHRRLGRTRHCRLDGCPEGPWDRFAPREIAKLGRGHELPEESARHLVHRYGRRAADVAAYLAQDAKLAQPVVPGEPDLHVEFLYQRDQEFALYPADHLLRRTRLGLFRPDLLKGKEDPLKPPALQAREC